MVSNRSSHIDLISRKMGNTNKILRALSKTIRFAASPMLRTAAFRSLRASREASRARISEIRNANQLLHIGNLFLLAGRHHQALKFYIAACGLDSETRWVSGRTLLDYVSSNEALFKNDLE